MGSGMSSLLQRDRLWDGPADMAEKIEIGSEMGSGEELAKSFKNQG